MLLLLLLRPPLRSSSHGSLLPHGHWPQRGPQTGKEREQAKAQPLLRAPHQVRKVRMGQDLRGVWLCLL